MHARKARTYSQFPMASQYVLRAHAPVYTEHGTYMGPGRTAARPAMVQKATAMHAFALVCLRGMFRGRPAAYPRARYYLTESDRLFWCIHRQATKEERGLKIIGTASQRLERKNRKNIL